MMQLNRELGSWRELVTMSAMVLSFAVMASAQQQKSPPARAGVEGGDLKPARMATVVLLYMYRSEKAANIEYSQRTKFIVQPCHPS